jgi:pimeloyl-ACP methyl ester carboxylesterase
MPSRRTFVLMSLGVTACAARDHALASAFKPHPGPHAVEVADLVLRDPARNKDLPLRVGFHRDRRGAPYPVVVLSPGGGSSKDDYTRIGDHWASHGYVVIAPTHKDARVLGFDIAKAGGPAMQDVMVSRMADMTFLAMHLDALTAAIPALATRLDPKRLVAAGHSMGGFTALAAAGLKLKNKIDGTMLAMDDVGYRALVLLSDPGKNPTMPDDPWLEVAIPTFVYTGTDDLGGESRAGRKAPYGNDAIPNPAAAKLPKHYLWVEGVNHYLGGLMCRSDVPGPPDYVGLSALNGASTAFLDAVTKNDALAQRFMNDPDGATAVLAAVTGGRARLSLRSRG